MSQLLVIAYDFNKEPTPTARNTVREAIRGECGKYAQLSESCYAIRSNEDLKTVFKRFKPHLDADDSLSIMPFTSYIATTNIKLQIKGL